MMKKITLFMLVAIFTMSGSLATAQKAMRHSAKKINKTERKEMRAYFQENIAPVLKIQRAELDKQISSEDQARIEGLRTEIKTQRTLMREKKMAMKVGEEKPTADQRKEMREMRNEMHNLMNEVEILSEKYHIEIFAALEPVKENAETWRRDMREMHQNMDRPERNMARGEKCNRPPGDGRPGHHKNPMNRLMNPVHFLLWNPDEAMPFFDDEAAMDDLIRINLFPNPASTNVQVSVELAEERSLEISILNRDGREVFPSETTTTDAGIYTKSFNLSELENGIYFVKVKAGEFNKIERLIIQK